MGNYECCKHCITEAKHEHVEFGGHIERDGHEGPCPTCAEKPEIDKDALVEVLMEHHVSTVVSASPGHWAYEAGENAWFASCGQSHEDRKGCGWTSKPFTYLDRLAAKEAGMEHLADEIKEALE